MSLALGFPHLSHPLSSTPVAETYRAEGPPGQRPWSVQVLRPEWVCEPGARARFLEEQRRLMELQHPGIHPPISFGELPDGRLFTASEALEGGDLATRLSTSGALSPAEAVELALALCAALDHAHGRGVTHGDLAPSRVLLPEGLAKPRLAGFGVPPPPCADPGCQAQAGSGVQRDLYALGALLHTCLTGGAPYEHLHLGPLPPPLPAAAAALSPVVLRCLLADPAERYASAAELAQELKDAQTPTLVRSPALASYPPVHEPPRVLGSYEVLGLLGEGAMGQVFQARHARLSKQVAIKVLKPEHARHRELLDRFFQEARAVNRINHEHIVEVHDFVEEQMPDGVPRVYFVMEQLAGKTLGAVLEAERMGVARAVAIARQVCDGLGAAHLVGVVHRDVKPDNIFITTRAGQPDYVKLLDFGVAKLATGEPGRATLAGTIMGTPEYMAPEQAAGRAVDARSDIWSLGVVLYEMLTLRRPFDAPAFGQLVVDINTKPVPPLPARTPAGEEIPRALEALVLRCLQKDPARRPASMEALSAELGEALSRRPPPASRRTPGEPEVGPLPAPEALTAAAEELGQLAARYRPRPTRWLGALVALGALAAGGVALEQNALPSAVVGAVREVPSTLQALWAQLQPRLAPAPQPGTQPTQGPGKQDPHRQAGAPAGGPRSSDG